jgi:antitoxin CptB
MTRAFYSVHLPPIHTDQDFNMDREAYLRKLHYRAHHRGTREADAIVGGFFDHAHHTWDANGFEWFERVLEEQDVDIMGWALGTIPVPSEFAGPMVDAMILLDYVQLPVGLSKTR